MAKSKRSHQKLPDKVTPGSRGSTESGSPTRLKGGPLGRRVQDEQDADQIGPAQVSVLESASGDNVTRNLLPELEEEGKSSDDDGPATMDVEDVAAMMKVEPGAVQASAPTPITKAVNAVPPAIPDAPLVTASRTLELLCEKHDALKHLTVTRVGASNAVRDPGFAAMKTQQELLNAIIGVFNTAGYSVAIRNQELILATDLVKLATAGQAVYDLFLRHQLLRWAERAVASAKNGLQNEEEFKALAEKYMGASKETVAKLKDDVMLKESLLTKMGTHLQDYAEKVDAAQAEAAEGRRAAAAAHAEAAEVKRAAAAALEEARLKYTAALAEAPRVKAEVQQEQKPDVKPEVKYEPNFITNSARVGSSDYLADIYEDCMKQSLGVNATTRLRMSAVSEVKSFDGRHRDEYKAKNFLSNARSAFIRDGISDSEACVQFPLFLTDRAKTWYRQLPRQVRRDWKLLQAEFEDEYCGGSISPQRRYFDARRKANEEPLDYLYRLNLLAQEAGITYATDGNGVAHVQHFIDTCEDASLARQLGALRLRQEPELRSTLKEMLRVDTRLRRDDAVPSRNRARDTRETRERDRVTPPPIGSKARPIVVDALKALASSASTEDDFESSEDDLDGCEVDDDDVAPDAVVGDDPVNALMKMIAALQQGKESKALKPEARTPCTHCGATSHRDRNCWSRLTCTACGVKGHPAEHCYQRCKGCGKVHERGECELARLADQMKAWFDPSNHAGLLPPAVEKWLN